MKKGTYLAAKKPTLYFIGVTTGQSSIMRIFPQWAAYWGLGDCEIKGIDFRPHDEKDAYREAVEFIKNDPKSLGALVTTHKIDLQAASEDLFDDLDYYAQIMGEISCISKHNSRLIGHAKDPISSGLAIEAFLPEDHWKETGAEVFLMGAGGSTIALTAYLVKQEHGLNRPSKVIVSNRSRPRLTEIEKIHKKLTVNIPVDYILTPTTKDNDVVVNGLAPHSLVINATGLGKDAPGSPITDAATFPKGGMAWDFNYRGDLIFLKQARAQQHKRNLQIEDGWIYFIHGWTQVIAEVFDVKIPVKGKNIDGLSKLASEYR